jgi:hypothetical protein
MAISIGSSNIVNFYPGNYLPGAETTLHGAVDLINASWKLGVASVNEAESKINNAIGQWLDAQNSPHITSSNADALTITEPEVDIPTTASTSDAMSLFEEKSLELVELLAAKFVAFRETWFPDEQTAYVAAEDWLQAAMDNPLGLPANVAQALMADNEARVLSEASRASESVLASFAARGFPLPPGAAAGAVLQIQQEAQNQLSESSRKIITASIEQMRWVIEQVMSLRQMSMNAAIEYIKALASGPEIASRVVNIGYDAQSKLINAASAFYNARINAAEAVSRVNQFNVSNELQASQSNQSADLALIDAKLKALISECQMLAQMATSLFNNLHVSAGMDYNVNVS